MANFDNGYIKVFRKMLDWEWFSDINTFYVFMYCLLKANWRDKKWRGTEIKRGSFVTSRHKLAQELHLTEMQIRTALEHLETTNEITKYASAKYTVITVVKYDDYQQDNQVNNQQNNQQMTNKSSNKQPTDNQLITTTEESNKGNKGKNTNIKPPHKGWIPADSHNARYVLDHPSEEGWVIEVVNGREWGHQVKG